MRRNVIFLVVTFVLILGSLGAVVATSTKPVLGLDLQGGISVVLAPVGKAKADALDKAKDIISNRVDALGVAEPEISRQGNNIVVDLPGVKDRDKASKLVGRTAELRFRPVLGILPPETKAKTPTTTTAKKGDKSASTSSSSTSSTTTTTTTPSEADAAAHAAVASCDPTKVAALASVPTTPETADKRDACVVLPSTPKAKPQVRYLLGKTSLTGKGVSTAQAEYQSGQGWAVNLKLNGSGSKAFNALAAVSYPKQAPQNAVAIVLDGVVQSAPAFQTSNFTGGNVQISGSFSQGDAGDLALVLRYGALPVQLKTLTSESVSPTLGKDQLHAGIAAGLIGLALIAIYMLVFYRVLGLVVIIGLSLSGATIYALVSYLGQRIGLTLTLAGVTGIIVSVGVTVDSYVVYFERLKDEVRMGKSLRASLDRGFTRSFRTIVAADLVSLIGALILYWLAVGSVRGFAFYLGLSTILDLVLSYFFMHPLVVILARSRWLVHNRAVGMESGLDARGASA